MLLELGKFEPFGKSFLNDKDYLINDNATNPAIDFSALIIGQPNPPPIKPFFHLFNSNLISNQITEKDLQCQDALRLDQEAYVHGRTVVWSRGGYVVKTLDYSLEPQAIQKVLFAQFFVDAFKVGKQATGTTEEESKGDSSDESSQSEHYKALCVVFKDYIIICREEATSITCHVPFDIGEVVPLDIGLIISRSYMPKLDRKRKAKPALVQSTLMSSKLPRSRLTKTPSDGFEMTSSFVTITNPLREACPVRSKDMNRIGASTLPLPFTDPQKVLFATTSASNSGRLPVIVTLNMNDKRHYVWTYDRRKNKGKVPNQTENNPSTRSLALSKKRHKETLPENSAAKKRQRMLHGVKLFQEGYHSDEDTLLEDEVEKAIYNEILDPSEISIRLLWKETHTQRTSTKLKGLGIIESKAFLVHDLHGQELVCILNHSLGYLQLINLDMASCSTNRCIAFKAFAKFAAPVYATRDRHIDLLMIDPENNLRLYIDRSIDKFTIKLPGDAVPVKLLDSLYDRFTIQYDNNEMYRFQLDLRPRSSLVRECLIAVDCGSTNDFPRIWRCFLDACFFLQQPSDMYVNEWKIFVVILLSHLKLKRRRTNDPLTKRTISEISCSSSDSSQDSLFNDDDPMPISWIAKAIEASKDRIQLSLTAFSEIFHNLHVVYEEYRIKKPTMMHARALGYLLLQCSVILNNEEWVGYYESQGLSVDFVHPLELVDEETRDIFIEPPNIQICLHEMTSDTLSKPTLLSSFGVNALEPTLVHYANTYAHTIKRLWSIYGFVNDASSDKGALLNRMISEGITRHDIEMLDDIIASPIREILNQIKSNPSTDWPNETYMLIGRNDMYKQLETKVTRCDPNIDIFKLDFFENSEKRVSMKELMKDQIVLNNEYTFKSDTLSAGIERLRFGFDGLIDKVRIMLDATRVPDHYVPERPDLSDDDLAEEHQKQVLNVIQRTLALSMGRGIYAFGTHIPDLTKALPVETITLSAKIQPLRTIVNLDEENITPEELLWPNFHNGVASSLRISPRNEVDGSWIDFCNAKELTPEHGGMLLGMGLLGVLKTLPLAHWFRFISHPCEQVSLGFILGASVNYRGTKHIKVTKVLAVHIPSLLPAGSNPFEHTTRIIATSILGMGLVYMKSCDRLMATAMLQELEKDAYSNPSNLGSDYEGCALAAGFAIGFITLGAGNRLLNIEELHLRNKLYSLMSGHVDLESQSNEQPKEGPATKNRSENREYRMNLDVTSPGATIALGLMYLKTENKKVADHVDILETMSYLNYVRPDFLLLRVVAKNLIMWSTIEPTATWIDGQLPDFITKRSNEQDEEGLDEEMSKQAIYSIIAGACLCIGLRFAGSKNEKVLEVLLSKLDFFMRLSTTPDLTAQQRVTKCTIKTGIDVLCTAAAMTMAGSGNQQVLHRLQQLYNNTTSSTSYGNHIAISMSLGLLFVGLGGYTLKTTHEAIAGLLCAFYPFYPINTEDNRYHLQAFRHLWVLAVDSRWLMPFDVDLKKPCRVPIQLELYDDNGSQLPGKERKFRQVKIEAPLVVPDYSLIRSIQLDSNRYWPLSVGAEASRYRESIIKSGVIYVKRKPNKLSYEEDPHGQREFDFS
ncbi:hypothetical protein G6F38_009611 [Rhizopus arrhizus]|nr:hypothetical protein G6F38_009611 [Rhizopus arrhizus]